MKLMKYGLLALAAAWILTGCTVHVSTSGLDNCKYQEERTATVPADQAKSLEVRAGAGSLRIEGRPGLTEVRVRGTACATTEDLVRKVELRTSKVGGEVRVEAYMPSVTVGNSPTLDLTLEVPESLVARITDTSGEIEVRRIAGVEVDDQSGSMSLVDITGPIRISDESGEIDIRNAGGDVTIPRDQSGNISMRGVRGNVTIDRDESGEIDVADVGGDVTINEDQSGSIIVRDVAGSFSVRRDGSGTIQHERVGGSVSIPAK